LGDLDSQAILASTGVNRLSFDQSRMMIAMDGVPDEAAAKPSPVKR
jgi:hypothetical protein